MPAITQKLPPLCFVRHPTTGETVEIHRGKDGYYEANTTCSPECLNARLAHPPTPEQVLAMKHGAIIGWDIPGADPALWVRSAQAGAR